MTANTSMINIRKYNESDARALWAIFYHTIRNVNSRDYTQAQVEVWAPGDGFIWQVMS
jgi:putative acetyltransferase